MDIEQNQCTIKLFAEPQPYEPTLQAMRQHILAKPDHDEIWFMEHEPVYTQGQAGKSEHILQQNHIPIIQSDRGGQVTYHGPGQLMVYTLINLRKANIGIRKMVTCLEQCVIQFLQQHEITAYAKADAPGVYIDEKKIASLGLRVRHGYCYHGMALNIDMDLAPFKAINPCGYKNLEITQIDDWVPSISRTNIQQFIIDYYKTAFCYEKVKTTSINGAVTV